MRYTGDSNFEAVKFRMFFAISVMISRFLLSVAASTGLLTSALLPIWQYYTKVIFSTDWNTTFMFGAL